MTRLPTPGGDDGNWGEILNTYLSTSLNADGTLKQIDKSKVTGIDKVDNTADADKPISDLTVTALGGKVDNTTTVNGHQLSSNVTVTATDVGLTNVDNTTDLGKPISTDTQSALDLKAGKPANVITVGASGCDFTTVQAAVNAAVAGGAGVGTGKTPSLVIGMPGVDRTHTSAPGIFVHFLEDAPLSRFGSLQDVTRQERPWFVPTSGGMIGLRVDDGQNDILAIDGTSKAATGAGWGAGNFNFGGLAIDGVACSPAAYAAYYGVPLTLCIIGQYVEAPGNLASKTLTAAQCASLAVNYGCELATHTYTHGSGVTPLDLSLANAYFETLYGKEMIEAFEIETGYKATMCKGWIEPGNIAVADMGSNWANMAAVWNRLVRANFEWSQGIFMPNGQIGIGVSQSDGFTQHHEAGYEITPLSATQVALGIKAAATRGCKTTLFWHSFESLTCTFKTLIDAIVAERTAGTLLPVSLNGLHNAYAHPKYTGDAATVEYPLISMGDFENMPTIPYVNVAGTTQTGSKVILCANTTGIVTGMFVNAEQVASPYGAAITSRLVTAVNPNVSFTVDGANIVAGESVICTLGMPTGGYLFNNMRVAAITRNAGVGVDATGGNPGKCLHIKTTLNTSVRGLASVYIQTSVVPGGRYVVKFDSKLVSGADPVWSLAFLQGETANDTGVARHTIAAWNCTAQSNNYETQHKLIGIPPWCTAIRLTISVGTWSTVSDLLLDNIGLYRVG